MRLFAKRGWSAIYTTGPLCVWDRNSTDWSEAPWFGKSERIDGLIVDRPGRLPLRWPNHGIDRRVLKWHAHRLRSLAGVHRSDEIVALVFHPSFWPNIEALQPRHVVYYQYDAFSKMPGWTAEKGELEERLVDRADLIVSVTESLARTLPGTGPDRARPLANAVRLDSFTDTANLPCPPDLQSIPHPRIGHIGTISIRLDLDLILSVAQTRPDCHFVFIGAVEREGNTCGFRDPELNEKWRRIRAQSNIHYIPPQPAELAPSYMAHMDINAMWYHAAKEGWWTYAKPIKMYEYLAIAKPVIATGLDGVREYSAVIDIADTAPEWNVAIDRALREGGVGCPAERIAVARDNTWAKRAETLEEWIFEMAGTSR
jgi:glycosyltransferase involved in cell wall biosynthesis